MSANKIKAGDTVYLQEPSGWNTVESRAVTVQKVTPSGQIVLEGGARFKDGRMVGDRWSRKSLVSLAEHEENCRESDRRKALRRLRDAGEALAKIKWFDLNEIEARFCEARAAYDIAMGLSPA